LHSVRKRIFVLLAVAAGFAAIAPTAFAAAPVLASVGSVSRHPTATWTLPAGVQAKVAEVATSPATGSDGYFFDENVEAFDVLTDTQTSWTDTSQLDPGTYYVHIGGLDEPCFYAGKCPVREFSQVMTLEIRPDTYSVSVTKLGAGAGTVTANGATISECGAATCTTTLIAGTSTFVATPAPDSEFVAWGGACSGTSTICTVTVDGPKSLSATFNKKSYAVSLTKTGSGTGTVTANGTAISECGVATCTATLTSGTSATFVATAAPDSDFASWGGACSGASTACTVTVDGATSITAIFSKKPSPPPTPPSSQAPSVKYEWRFLRPYASAVPAGNVYRGERLTIRLHARGLAAGTTRPYLVCVLKPHGQRCVRDVLRGPRWDTRPWRIMARDGRNGRYTWFVRIGGHIVLKKSLRIYE
jgi:hypothetical protein